MRLFGLMKKKSLMLFLSCSLVLQASYIPREKIAEDKRVLQVSSCSNRACVIKAEKALKDDKYHIVQIGNTYGIYIVNIESEEEMELLKKRFTTPFSNPIERKASNLIKQKDSAKKVQKHIFKIERNQDATAKVEKKFIVAYKNPHKDSLQTGLIKKDSIFYLEGCSLDEWCRTRLDKDYVQQQDINITDEVFDLTTFIGRYKQALKYFKDKKYEKSYQLLKQLFNEKSNDKNINFYLGRTAYETKRYDEAITAYERFLFEEPDNSRVKLEMARSYYMDKSYKEAKKLLLEVQKDPNLPPKVRKVVEFYLALVDSKISKHFISGILMFGANYDSNINTRSKHDTFNNVYFPTYDIYLDLSNSTEDASAWYNQEVAMVNYFYKLSDTMKNKHDVMVFNKDSIDSKYNTTDVVLLAYTPALSVQHNERLVVDYALYTDILWYGNQKYLKTIALNPKIQYIHDKKNILSGYFKYQSKSYELSSNKSKDSYYTEIAANLSHIYSKQLIMMPSIVLKDEEKKSGNQSGVDYSGLKLGFGVNYIYKPTLFFNPSLSYTYARYEGQDPSYLVQEEDKQLKLALGATYVYAPEWIFQATTDYTYQTSTLQTKEYDKYTFGVNVIRLFK